MLRSRTWRAGTDFNGKVVAGKPSAVSLLKVQYRMHENILRFSSDWFYGGELEAAPEIRHRGILDWDTPVTWLDTSATRPRKLVGPSRESKCWKNFESVEPAFDQELASNVFVAE